MYIFAESKKCLRNQSSRLLALVKGLVNAFHMKQQSLIISVDGFAELAFVDDAVVFMKLFVVLLDISNDRLARTERTDVIFSERH